MLFVLSLIPMLKQQPNELINRKSQTTRYQKSNLLFYNEIINIEEFNSSLLKTGKIFYNDIDIYCVKYIII